MRNYIKRAAAAVLTGIMTVTLAGNVLADETTDFEEALQASYDIVPDTNNIQGWPQGPHVYGGSAIVMDMDSGAVLYGKKADERHYPASITKILTALVALENSKPDDEVYFSEDSVSFLEYGDASIGMTPGEILSMNDALYGMLLASANEVSYAIAESVGKQMGGGYDTFIQEMNDRSAELGCTGSHWTNANGLHSDQHYTTARDMALIASAAYQFEEFRTVTQTLNYTIGATNLVGESRTFQQNHKMLWEGGYYYYEYCTGGKTGYTDQSRTTLVTMADNGDLQLVAVFLQDDGDVYTDTRAMFDYAFANFSKVSLKDQPKAEGVRSYEDENAYVLLPSGIGFSSLENEVAITDEKEAAGEVTYYYEGQNVGSAAVTLTPEYVRERTGYDATPQLTGNDNTEEAAQKEAAGLPLPIKVLIGVGVAVLLIFIILYGAAGYQLAKRRRLGLERARRRRQTGRVSPARQNTARQSPARRYAAHQSPTRQGPARQRPASSRSGRTSRQISRQSPQRRVRRDGG